jgi:hypothetical protein
MHFIKPTNKYWSDLYLSSGGGAYKKSKASPPPDALPESLLDDTPADDSDDWE